MPRFTFPPSARLAVSLIFLIRGITLGNWFPRIPGIADRLSLSSSELGLLMFGTAAGCLFSFGIAARLMRRRGSAKTILLFSIPYPIVFALIGLAPNLLFLAIGMIAFGLVGGGYDISTSVQGGVVERHTRQPLISSLYGFFSLGALIGSATGGFAAQTDVSLFTQFTIISLIAVPTVIYLTTRLLPDESRKVSTPRKRRRFALTLPPRVLLPFGIMVFCVALGEETINNWVALYLRQDLGTSAGIGAMAYTAFSVSTLAGRLLGDRIISRIGVDRVLTGGSLLAAAGIGFGVLINQPWSVLAGYAIVGAGLSVVVPVTYRAAGTIPGVSPGDAAAGIASIGYMGYLVGPILVGFISDIASLRVAFALVAVSLIGISVMVRRSPMDTERPTVTESPMPDAEPATA